MADRDPSMCKANGCPLRWTVPTHWHEPENKREPRRPRWGVCDYHHAAPAEQWTATTRRMQAERTMLQFIATAKNIHDTRFKPRASETAREWMDRMDKLMRQQILVDNDPAPGIKPGAFDSIYQQLGLTRSSEEVKP